MDSVVYAVRCIVYPGTQWIDSTVLSALIAVLSA